MKRLHTDKEHKQLKHRTQSDLHTYKDLGQQEDTQTHRHTQTASQTYPIARKT